MDINQNSGCQEKGPQCAENNNNNDFFFFVFELKEWLSNSLGFVNGSSCGVFFLLPSIFDHARCLMSRSILFTASVTTMSSPHPVEIFSSEYKSPFPSRRGSSWAEQGVLTSHWPHYLRSGISMLLKKQRLFKHKDLMSSGWAKQWKSVALSQFYFPPDIYRLLFPYSQSNRSWLPSDRRGAGWESHFPILHVGRLCGRCLQVWTKWFQQSSVCVCWGLLTNQKLPHHPHLCPQL